MKKIININLGGLPYIIDEDAYEELNKYLSSIRRHFASSEGCEEILYDIELRLSELFQEQLKAKQIITISELNAAIAILGTPEEFGAHVDDEAFDTSGTSSANSSSKSTHKTGSGAYSKTGKKLFRDEEDKVIGGVCSGIAAYFGVHDPLWVRLAFAAGLFAGGVAVPFYILLLVIVPKAKTAADRLAMRGEPINLENIAKTVEDEINDLADSFSKLKDKKKSGKTNDYGAMSQSFASSMSSTVTSGFYGIFRLVGDIIIGAYTLLIKILKPFISIITFLLICVGLILITSSLFVFFKVAPFLSVVGSASVFGNYAGTLASLMLVLVPLASIILWFSKWFFPKQMNGVGKWLGLTWVVAFVTFLSFGLNFATQFGQEYTANEYINLSNKVASKNITLDFAPKPLSNNSNIHLGGMLLNTENNVASAYLKVTNPVNIQSVESDQPFRIREEIFARGSDETQARANGDMMKNQLRIDKNTLTFPTYFAFNKDVKFRGQYLSYIIELPKGYAISVASDKRDNVYYSSALSEETINDMVVIQ